MNSDDSNGGGEKFPIRKEIADLLKEIEKADGLPEETREKLRSVLIGIVKIEETFTSVYSFSGPVPSPEAIALYKKQYPNAPKVIFDMANRESTTKEAYVTGNLKNDRLKIIGSTIGYFGVLGLSALALFLDKETAAITLGISGVIALIIRAIQRWFE